MRGRVLLIRVVQMVLVVLAVVTIAFFVLRSPPVTPPGWSTRRGRPEDIIAQTRAQIGTDVSMWQQYVNYLSGAVTGDLGTSFRGSQPVGERGDAGSAQHPHPCRADDLFRR
jgi:peptide/nickel transport system permease protein